MAVDPAASHVSKTNEQTVIRWGPPALTGKPNKITNHFSVSMCDNDVCMVFVCATMMFA